MTEPVADPARVSGLCAALDMYRPARQQMLAALCPGASNRDPLAEWSEHLAAALTGGTLALSRVQAAYDLTTPDGATVQVRYLANSSPKWVNEHTVRTVPGAARYALVLFEAFTLIGVLMFPADLTDICAALGKRHGEPQATLQFTGRNWRAIRDDPNRFRALGMRIWLPPFAPEEAPAPPSAD
jgi:hypothetical protein